MWLNPQHSSCADTSHTNATHHYLSGRAQQIMMCSNTSACAFYFSFDSTSLSASHSQRITGDTPVIFPVDHPDYVTILATASGYVYITEFV